VGEPHNFLNDSAVIDFPLPGFWIMTAESLDSDNAELMSMGSVHGANLLTRQEGLQVLQAV